jgi:repressor LexA
MEPKIRSGDLVIAQKRNIADNGSLVICVNNEEVLIKKYYTDGKQTILRSENSKYDPFIASNDFKIEGIVKGIINYS